MATGDIRNNLKMLSAEIRSVKTPSALVNLEGMMAGDPEVYLPIYDYLFQWYSTRLANEILRKDLKLPPYKHNRTKFLETMYLVLRELFQWKPPLSTSQFFSSGFAEKKVCPLLVGQLLGRVPAARVASHYVNAREDYDHRGVYWND